MSQEELGKNEEQEQASSAELPASDETVANSNGTQLGAEEAQEQDAQGTEGAVTGPAEGATPDVAATTEVANDSEDADDSVQASADDSDADDDGADDYDAEDAEGAGSATHAADDDDDGGDNAGAEAASQEPPPPFSRGDLIEASIARTSPTALYVNLGDGYEGVVPRRELELMSNRLLDQFSEGAPVVVYVVNPRNHRGDTILSINQALEELDWREAETYRRSKEVYDGKIGGYNKGGLIVRFGQLRGFVPQSQIGDVRLAQMEGETPEERYGPLVNDAIAVKVMEVDRQRNRLILSERAAMREVRQRAKETLITELRVDEIREGLVVSLENFGAFVDIGGAEGLVHITEISWDHITHPRQALNVGDTVQVKVINVDPSQNRIGLSIKQLQADPWDEIAAEYPAGTLVRGTVTKLTKFGAFARIEAKQAVEGLIHISELSEERVEHPREVVQRGDDLTLRVVKVDVKNRRLGLSLKRVNSPEFLDDDLRRVFQTLESEVEDDEVNEALEQLIAEQSDGTEGAETEQSADAEATLEMTEAALNTGEAETVLDDAEDAAEPEAEVAEDMAEPEAEVAEDAAEPEAEVAEAEAEDMAEPEAEVAEDAAEPEAEVAEAEAEDVAEPEAEVAEDTAEPEAEVAEDVAEPEAEVAEDTAEPEAEVAEAEPTAETAGSPDAEATAADADSSDRSDAAQDDD